MVTPIPVNLADLLVDATSLASILVDLPPNTLRKLQTEQEGYSDVQDEILKHQPTIGRDAGIPDKDVQEIVAASEQVTAIDAVLPRALKLVEILMESRAYYDDKRQRRSFSIAATVEDRASRLGETELLAAYDKTCAYRSAIANKAAKTRRRNAELAAAKSEGDAADKK